MKRFKKIALIFLLILLTFIVAFIVFYNLTKESRYRYVLRCDTYDIQTNVSEAVTLDKNYFCSNLDKFDNPSEISDEDMKKFYCTYFRSDLYVEGSGDKNGCDDVYIIRQVVYKSIEYLKDMSHGIDYLRYR